MHAMKTKIADRPNWSRIIRKRYFQQYVRDDSFEGHLSFLFLDEVKDPLRVKYGSREVCIVDHNYVWMMFFPVNKPYSLTVMVDRDHNVVQWYFDIIKSIQLTNEGVPVIEDLFLDLVVLPNGELYLLDEDELAAALENKEIDETDFMLASEAMKDLRTRIDQGRNELINKTETYLKLLRNYQ